MASSGGDTLRSNPSTPTGPEPGTVLLGKYRVEKLLGVGGMGRVFEVTHLGLHQSFAIKLLLGGAIDDNGTARLLREARNSAQVKNEHAVRVVDVGVLSDDAPYIVMELLAGEDLARVLKRETKLPAERAVEWLLQACEAIAEAHVMGLVHRDLKPSNLFLTRNSTGEPLVKVLDFGLSKSTEGDSISVTTTTSLLGTPAYMSPEQLRSSRDVDARSDVWALGVVLYEFVTGDLPFPGTSPAEVAAAVFRDPPRPIPAECAVPEGLKKVITTCLKKDPLDRYPNISELANALAKFGGPPARRSRDAISMQFGVPAAAHSSAIAVGADSPPRRWLVAGALVAALIVGAFGIIFAKRALEEEPAPQAVPTVVAIPAPTPTVATAPVALAPSPAPLASSHTPSAVPDSPVIAPKAPPTKPAKNPRQASGAKPVAPSSASPGELFDTTK